MGVSVGDDFIRQSKPLIHIFEVQVGYAFSGYGHGAWKEKCRLGAPMIYDHEDGIVPFALGECCNQVHGHNLEGESFQGNGDFIQGDLSSVLFCWHIVLCMDYVYCALTKYPRKGY